MDLKLANLETITSRYFDGTGAAKGAAIIDRSVTKELPSVLEKLLRSHLVSPPGTRTIQKRQQIDELLAYYSLLEVASQAGFIPYELPDNVVAAARRRLSEPSVRRYYEKYYPLLLPQLFLRRITGGESFIRGSDEQSTSHFFSLLQVGGSLFDPDVDVFMGYLEDGVYYDDEEEEGTDLSDVLDTLLRKRKLVRHLTVPPEEQTALEMGLHGLLKFLRFCRSFDELLLSMQGDRMLQSAFWHFHGYWFQLLGGQIGGVIGAAIEEYRKWVPEQRETHSEKDLAAIRSTHESMDQAHLQLQRLTSAYYRAPLDIWFYGETQLDAGLQQSVKMEAHRERRRSARHR